MPHKTVHDIQMYYETHGSADNPTLLFVHGLGSSSRDWELQVPYFEHDYHVLTLDVRGHGQSSKPKAPYAVPQFAKDIVGLLDALNIEKVHLAGISMGGMIAFQMALDDPERLHSISIVNATGRVRPKNLRERTAIWMRFLITRFFRDAENGCSSGRTTLHQA